MITGEIETYLTALGTQPREAWGVHPRPDALIDGLSGTATRTEAREHLGEPVWESDTDDRFRVGDDIETSIRNLIALNRERGVG